MSEKKGQEPIEEAKKSESAKKDNPAAAAKEPEKNNAEKDKAREAAKKKLEERIKKEQEEQLKKKKEELDLYLKEGLKFETIRGEKVVCPPLNGIAEKTALRILIKFILKNPDVMMMVGAMQGNNANLGSAAIIKMLSGDSGEEATTAITEISAALLGKTEEWVDEHLLLAEQVKVVRPFFLIEAKTLSALRAEM